MMSDRVHRGLRSARIGLSLLALLVAAGALVGCASTQLEVGPNDPTSPKARTEPPPAVGRALDPDFEPQVPDSLPSSKPAGGEQDEHHALHAHGAPQPEHQHGTSHHDGTGEQQGGSRAEQALPARSDESQVDAPKQWTCTMHPKVITSEPGRCPICGMTLVPVPGKKPSGAAP